MKIQCLYDELVSVSELKKKFHPKNRNKHPQGQIERLSKILLYQGVRHPVKISKRSGLITTGHGRVLCAEYLGWETYPVNYQEYDSKEQEIADLNADNAIGLWSELDQIAIKMDVLELGVDFNRDLLGFNTNIFDDIKPTQVEVDPAELANQYIVACYFTNEEDMHKFFEEVRERSIECKLIT